MSSLPELIAAKTVTISNLMTVVPIGTIDPSAVMHNEAFAVLAGMSAVGATSNMAALWAGPYMLHGQKKEDAASSSSSSSSSVLVGGPTTTTSLPESNGGGDASGVVVGNEGRKD